MKLIVHPGLHKTGSTYLQHVLNDNHAELAARGVYYEPQPGYPAHHSAAWQILTGNPQPLIAMINKARKAGCTAVILSSEDLEGALYDERPLAAIEAASQSAGISETEWHVVLRDPGAAFQSLFAQLQHHIYADAFQLFYDVMRRGFVHIAAPMPNEGTPYWYYSFDHSADLDRLHRRTGEPVIAHDFDAKTPFPGAAMLEGLGVLDALARLPGNAARNARPARDDIIRGYVARIAEALPDAEDQSRVTDGFLTCFESGLENLSTYGELVRARYAPSREQALSRFGVALVDS